MYPSLRVPTSTLHNSPHSGTFPPSMPPKPKTKQWGHKDKKRLFDLIKENNVDITNTSPKNIKVI
jgi:hypothetical protein